MFGALRRARPRCGWNASAATSAGAGAPWAPACQRMYEIYALYDFRAMAATTLRIDTRQKRRFDVLQSRLRLMTGRRITQAELLERLLDQAEAEPEKLAGRRWRPLTKAQIARVMELPQDFGIEIGDVDEGLYGKARRGRP